MSLNENLKRLREEKQWSQEETAGRIGMSKNGYAKIERGEAKPSLQRLERITQVFGVEMTDLFSSDKGLIYLFSENSQNSSNYYANNESLIIENEKLKLIIQQKDEMLAIKDEQIKMLQNCLAIIHGEKIAD